jgi:hypothetical protein
VAGHLRAISWNYAFIAAAVAIVVMLVITVLFYEEPPREIESATLGRKLREIGTTLADRKFSTFLVLRARGAFRRRDPGAHGVREGVGRVPRAGGVSATRSVELRPAGSLPPACSKVIASSG